MTDTSFDFALAKIAELEERLFQIRNAWRHLQSADEPAHVIAAARTLDLKINMSASEFNRTHPVQS